MAQRHVRSLLLVALLASAFLAVTVRASLSREELVEHLMEGEELDEHGQPIIVRNRNKVKRVRIGGHPGRAQHGSVVLAVFPSSSSFFFFFWSWCTIILCKSSPFVYSFPCAFFEFARISSF